MKVFSYFDRALLIDDDRRNQGRFRSVLSCLIGIISCPHLDYCDSAAAASLARSSTSSRPKRFAGARAHFAANRRGESRHSRSLGGTHTSSWYAPRLGPHTPRLRVPGAAWTSARPRRAHPRDVSLFPGADARVVATALALTPASVTPPSSSPLSLIHI